MLLWFLLITATLLLILLHTPAVQRRIGHQVSEAISEKLGTHVSIGNVDIGLLNRIIIDDVEIYDQQGEKMLAASRLSAKVDIPPLMKGRISISSAQIFGMKAQLYKADAESPLNIQFALDSLASKDDSKKTPLDLNINSLVVRNGTLSYDRKDVPPCPGRISPHHLRINNLSGHAILNHLTDNSIDLKIKKISFTESTGLDLRDLALNFKADTRHAQLTDLRLALPGSIVEADTLEATYKMEEGHLQPGSLSYKGNIGRIQLQPSDLAFALPSLSNITETLSASAHLSGTSNGIAISDLNLRTESTLSLAMSGTVGNLDTTPEWFFNVGHIQVQAPQLQHLADNIGLKVQIPQEVKNLGTVGYRGDIGGKGKSYALMGQLTSDAGDVELAATLEGNHFSGHADTNGFNLATITGTGKFGMLETTMEVEGHLPISRQMDMYAKGIVGRIDYDGHTYTNITIDGHYDNEKFEGLLGLDDANGKLALEGKIDLSTPIPSANITASAHNLNPEALGLTKDIPGHLFDFELTADVSGTSIDDLQGTADIDNFHLHAPGKDYHLNTLHIDADHRSPTKHLDVDTDFGQLSLSGGYSMETLLPSAFNVIKSKLPNLVVLPTTKPTGNRYDINADITDSEWITDLTGKEIHFDSPLHLTGHVDEGEMLIDMTCQTPTITYNGTRYNDLMIDMSTSNDTIYTNITVEKASDEEDEKGLELKLSSKASGGLLYTDIHFDNNGGKQHLTGDISTVTDFMTDSNNGQAAKVSITPSKIYVNGTPWDLLESDISYEKNDLAINGLTIENGGQYLRVSGALTNDITDAIHVDINQLDAQFLSNLLHVRGLDFGGQLSGNAFITSMYDTPTAKASLHIDRFTFEHGHMGDLDVAASWNAQDNRIDINGAAKDGDKGRTDINGYVKLSPGEINLDIGAKGTPLHFLEGFCSSFISGIDARIDGNVRVFGPLKTVNIEGKVVSNGDIHLSSLNTTYTMRNDTVTVVPDHILFARDTITDRDGNIGILEGSINHTNLSKFNVDLDIKAKNLLCYDFKQFGDETFCGTVYATGDCHVSNRSGETIIDIDATPERNTVFWYNAASPDALSRQDFIKWNDATPEAIDYSGLPSASDPTPRNYGNKQAEETDADDDTPSDFRMNFNINATPNATLRLLMDEESGDYIALNGRGNLRATYFNKGSFNIYGNYVVDHGIYKLTIQNVLRKDFQFEQGGTIGFGGNAFEAALNLQAIHTVNGVSLSDLNLGNSFTTNNIRVNCIMNISGTAQSPTVDFDLETPTMSSDAEQMIRSVINSEEELNQQVIYLLAIGRFYNQNGDQMSESGQSQTSLAMQSLLSGTISQQINTLLSNFITTSNWNFGANISTGDEGFNNAEYEGLLSGRLLDNRLLINGQFGYRDNPNATTSFIGDFDIQYLLKPNGNLAVKVYNQTNDRYFIKNSLNTQGVGLIMKKDFNGWRELLGIKRKKKKKSQ